ncbi:hypothetical protein HDU85_007255 [Gaertneriomyces sp. JEL0708]|nr:hypothetical protein HDU85_007255 [Gaertneriomyces sp. JEL0708]
MLACSSLKPQRILKHSTQVDYINSVCQRVNVQSTKEPTKRYNTADHSAQQRKMRPDLELTIGSQTIHLDISNTDAHAVSCRPHALKIPGGAIAHRENKKIFKYKGATDLLRNTSFVPVIFDQYGGMGQHLVDFLKMFARFIRDNCLVDSPKELMTSLYDSLSCIVVKENAKMILAHLSISGDNIANGKHSADQPTPSKTRRVRQSKSAKKRNNQLTRTTSTTTSSSNRRQTIHATSTVNRSRSLASAL